MNSIVHLKNSLITRINDSDDLNFLKAVQAIFDNSDKELFYLNTKQEESIRIGRAEIKNGKFIEHEKIMSNLKSC